MEKIKLIAKLAREKVFAKQLEAVLRAYLDNPNTKVNIFEIDFESGVFLIKGYNRLYRVKILRGYRKDVEDRVRLSADEKAAIEKAADEKAADGLEYFNGSIMGPGFVEEILRQWKAGIRNVQPVGQLTNKIVQGIPVKIDEELNIFPTDIDLSDIPATGESFPNQGPQLSKEITGDTVELKEILRRIASIWNSFWTKDRSPKYRQVGVKGHGSTKTPEPGRSSTDRRREDLINAMHSVTYNVFGEENAFGDDNVYRKDNDFSEYDAFADEFFENNNTTEDPLLLANIAEKASSDELMEGLDDTKPVEPRLIKKSELLKSEAAAEDNDFKAMGISKQAIRESRNEKFEEKWLPKLKKKFGVNIVFIESMGCWSIYRLPDNVDFYPKANKIFIHGKKEWIKPGLTWIIKNLLKDK
ncbi:MAG: hypothetical protein PHT07_21610 [Paludibacter sp.]|nr:hypothetical protein [Paludibacter sp.]